MSKKEKIQTKINIYCIYLATALASFVAIVGFIFTSFASLPVWLCVVCAVGAVIVAAIIVLIQLHLNSFCDEIERL